MSSSASAPWRLQLLTGVPVLAPGEGELVPVRAPDQAAYVDAAAVGGAEQPDHGRPRIVGELLVGVAAPVGEHDQVTRPGLLDPFLQLGEVGRAVDQRAYVIAARPRLLAGMDVIQHGLRVGPFAPWSTTTRRARAPAPSPAG